MITWSELPPLRSTQYNKFYAQRKKWDELSEFSSVNRGPSIIKLVTMYWWVLVNQWEQFMKRKLKPICFTHVDETQSKNTSREKFKTKFIVILFTFILSEGNSWDLPDSILVTLCGWFWWKLPSLFRTQRFKKFFYLQVRLGLLLNNWHN